LCRELGTGSDMMIELPLDHEPSLDHWAKCIADEDMASGYHTDWHHAYEIAWEILERGEHEQIHN